MQGRGKKTSYDKNARANEEFQKGKRFGRPKQVCVFVRKAIVVLKDAQMDRLRRGEKVTIRLRDTEVELRHAPSLDLNNLFDELLHHGGKF